MPEESNVFVLMSGDCRSLLVTCGAGGDFFVADWKAKLLERPDLNPVTFPSRDDAREHIAAKGYNQFTRVEVWER